MYLRTFVHSRILYYGSTIFQGSLFPSSSASQTKSSKRSCRQPSSRELCCHLFEHIPYLHNTRERFPLESDKVFFHCAKRGGKASVVIVVSVVNPVTFPPFLLPPSSMYHSLILIRVGSDFFVDNLCDISPLTQFGPSFPRHSICCKMGGAISVFSFTAREFVER